MSVQDDLSAIFDRIANGEETEGYLQALRELFRKYNCLDAVQLGKYNVNIGQGQDIHIGDRIYQGADAEAIREIVRSMLQELLAAAQSAVSGEIIPQSSKQNQLSVDQLVQQVRSRLHDDIQRLHSTMPLWGVDRWVPLGELFVDVNILEELNVLVKKISQLQWREIFLLNSEIVPDPDSLLSLIELSVNNLIAKDQKAQDFLRWVSKKSDSLKTSYQPISLRAFYFETAFTLVIAPKKANDAKLACLNENGGLTLFLEGAFALVLTRSCKDGIQESGYGNPQLSLDYMLVYALVLSLAFSNESTSDGQLYPKLFERLDDRLERALASAQELQTKQVISEIKNNLQDFIDAHFHEICNDQISEMNNTNELPVMKIVRQFIQSWSQSLRKFMLNKRDIGHDWNFSDNQIKILREYYYTNVTLTQCLNGDTKVSAKLRQEIEERMILPIAEIEKRKRGQAE